MFNILRLGSRSLRKSLGLTALFGAALSLIVFFSAPSDSQNPLGCLGSSATAAAPRSPDINELAVGMNTSMIADWATELPFLDSFKSARPWITQCKSGESGCSGSWSTDEDDQLDLDEHGWVKSLPAPDDSPEYTRVGTLLFRGIEGRYPGGQYVVLYEGEGTIEYDFDAEKDEAVSRPGRDVLNVTPSADGILMQITVTDPNKTGNYIRNIHVVPIEYETTFQTEIFNPAFLEKMQPFTAIRFMNWMGTNDSEHQEWSDRPTPDDAYYSDDRGAPVEIMVALANRLGATPWFNMPHKATDEYITNFAQEVKTCLNPDLNVYVEFSNEVWNWQFQQAHDARDAGQARWGEDKGDAFMQWYGMRTAQMSDIWNQVFSEQSDRVISVMATQTGWHGLEESALDCPLWVAEGNAPCYQHGIDVYAITGYFSGKLGMDSSKDTVKSWLDDSDGGFGKAFTQINQGNLITNDDYDDTLPGVADQFRYHQNVAQERGLQLVVYEGGQHLVRSDDEELTEFFIELNRRPEMYEAYSRLLDMWKQAGGNLFMHYANIRKPNRWGSWGALEFVDQDSSPKYDALIDFINRNT